VPQPRFLHWDFQRLFLEKRLPLIMHTVAKPLLSHIFCVARARDVSSDSFTTVCERVEHGRQIAAAVEGEAATIALSGREYSPTVEVEQ
jgi:hypothetical protein